MATAHQKRHNLTASPPKEAEAEQRLEIVQPIERKVERNGAGQKSPRLVRRHESNPYFRSYDDAQTSV